MASRLKAVPPAIPADAASPQEPGFLAEYLPAQTRVRQDGWTVERQRRFLIVLAETGCVSEACRGAGVSSRSAYRLRQHPGAAAFAAAWDQALRLATLRLTTVAYERAIRGTVREVWRDGERVAETRTPSDRLLVFLLGHLLPRSADQPSRMESFDRTLEQVRVGFPGALDRLTDHAVEMEPIQSRDFFGTPPGDPSEDW